MKDALIDIALFVLAGAWAGLMAAVLVSLGDWLSTTSVPVWITWPVFGAAAAAAGVGTLAIASLALR